MASPKIPYSTRLGFSQLLPTCPSTHNLSVFQTGAMVSVQVTELPSCGAQDWLFLYTITFSSKWYYVYKILYIENNGEFQNLEAVLGHRPPSSPLWPRGPLSHALSEEPGQPEDVVDGDL